MPCVCRGERGVQVKTEEVGQGARAGVRLGQGSPLFFPPCWCILSAAWHFAFFFFFLLQVTVVDETPDKELTGSE